MCTGRAKSGQDLGLHLCLSQKALRTSNNFLFLPKSTSGGSMYCPSNNRTVYALLARFPFCALLPWRAMRPCPPRPSGVDRLCKHKSRPWFKPFVMTVGVVIGKNGKFGRSVWDVQPVPGHTRLDSGPPFVSERQTARLCCDLASAVGCVVCCSQCGLRCRCIRASNACECRAVRVGLGLSVVTPPPVLGPCLGPSFPSLNRPISLLVVDEIKGSL